MRKFNTKFFRRALCVAVNLLPLTFSAVHAAESAGGDPNATSLRLSPAQYKQTIADVFGTNIVIDGRFEPEVRERGLLALGARWANVSDIGIERYDDLARGISAQVVGPNNRGTLISCKPKSETAADDACARMLISKYGRLLYRRALNENEIATRVKLANDAATTTGDFYAGFAAVLSDMLISPNFLFRYRTVEADPAKPGAKRLDGYSKATALSYFLWNSTPDDQLIKAAENGELQTVDGLQRQVDRMVGSPSMESGIRAFFADMLHFSDFETIAKDTTYFPRYSTKINDLAQEQTLKTIVDHVLANKDYRDLITTRDTYLTRSLAALYGVPITDTADNGEPDRFIKHRYPEGDPRVGILSHVSFLALNSHSARTSPTLRGKALRENLMCQVVPAPPGNVDFTAVEDTASETLKTGRDRLLAHSSNPVCAGCHKITDPIGLALETFDAAGGYRTTENGAKINTIGVHNNVNFQGAADLLPLIRNDRALTSCVARKIYAFGTGKMPPRGSAEWDAIEKKFGEDGYNVLRLMRQVALSDIFYAVPPAEVDTATRN